MKLRVIWCITLIVCIIIMCSACGNGSIVSHEDKNTITDNIADSSTATTATGNSSSETPLTTLQTYDEYIEFIEGRELPEEFVTYEMLKVFGEFDGLVMLCKVEYGDYSFSFYSFIDEAGIDYHLYVDCGRIGPTADPLPVIENVNTSNMRRRSETDKGRYIYNGVEYAYVNGVLLSISWELDGRKFILYNDGGLGLYPEDINETIVGRLMNTQNVESVMAEIAASLQKTQ